MGVSSGCGEQEAGVASGSGWNLWVWLYTIEILVVRRYIDFLILLNPTPLVSVLFYSSIPTFVHLKKCFSILFQYFFIIQFYVLNNFPPQYKHTYGQLRASHGSYMKAAHNVLYMKKHTQTYASYSAMDISCMTSTDMPRSRSSNAGHSYSHVRSHSSIIITFCIMHYNYIHNSGTCAPPILNATRITRAGEHTVFPQKDAAATALTQLGDYYRAATIRSAAFIQGKTVSLLEPSLVSKREL